jgi:O-acetyl-ADP-ribose deacetylase (regulator of RNase III)/uncharacterized protein YwgA
MFKALIGDLFSSQAQTLVNTVNCVGIMGKGVAQEFKKRFPAMFVDYAYRCARKEVRLGEPYLFKDPTGRLILNFPTKDHWRSPSRLSDIERGLDYFLGHYRKWGITSIVFPPLGCGNGGLHWSEVGPLIYEKLHRLNIDVEVYAPYGTPKQQLTSAFLSSPFQLELETKGAKHQKLNPQWVVVMEVLRELERQPYARPVGRTFFQKICYLITEIGVDTSFEFGKGTYGPFAEEAKRALHEFANRNWLQEEHLGHMIALRTTKQYENEREKYASVLDPHREKVNKAVDLFSRMKNSEQAEEVMTVLFASRQLMKAHPKHQVAEQQLYDYILAWKRTWQTEAKKKALASAIRNLVMLGWMHLSFSDTLPDVT